MGRAHIEAEVRAVITDVARVDGSAIGPDEDLVERLGIDSLQGLQMLAAVEKRFALRLPDEDLVRLNTIGHIADVVVRLQGRGAS